MTRKCVVDRRNEKQNNCNIAMFKHMVLTLGDFIPVKPWSDSHIACLAEIRMIWRDKNEHSLLTGLRLYFLPENTPSGRNCHGEDEVLAISDKVVIRAEDLLNWFDEKLEWNWGLINTSHYDESEQNCKENTQCNEENLKFASSLKKSRINFSDIQIEKKIDDKFGTNIIVMSYPRYCRYRATLKRLEGVTDEWFRNSVVAALCGFNKISPNYRVMFCRDTFDYPELETHELLCNHLAPKLKGRRRKHFSRSDSPFSATKKNYDSSSDSNESDISVFSVANEKVFLRSQQTQSHLRCNYRAARKKGLSAPSIYQNYVNYNKVENNKKNKISVENYNEENKFLETNIISNGFISNHLSKKSEDESIAQEKFFLRKLHEFHIRKNNDIPQMLWLSLKGIHLYSIFRQVKKLGGYEAVTDKKLWKNLFGEKNLPHITITRRKYAKLLLPLEESDDVFRKNEPPIKLPYIESGSDNKAVSIMSDEGINLKVKIKDEISHDSHLMPSTGLNTKDMTKIQSKLKSNRNEIISADDVKFVTTLNSTTSKISVPVTVIVETAQDSKDIISNDNEKNSITSSNTKCGNNLSKQFQIQQPHTTITFHQTTIHPHTNSNKITNKIQITNQIQIQQITVQPDMNVGKNQESKFIKIQENHLLNSENSKQNKLVKNSENILTKTNVPFIAPGTTITPVLSTFGVAPLTRKKFPINKNVSQTANNISSRSSSQNTSEINDYSLNQDLFSSFKKRKLDILREGGLEVTAISNKHGVISPSVPLSIPKLNKNLGRNSKLNLYSDVTVSSTNRINAKKHKYGHNCMYTKTDKIFGNPKEMIFDFTPYTSGKETSENILDLTVNNTPIDIQTSNNNFTNQSTSNIPLDLSTAFITPNIPSFCENGLQITLVPSTEQTSIFQPMTYTQNVHNSQNHNMKRKAIDTVETASKEILEKIKKSSFLNETTTLTNLSSNLNSTNNPFPFPSAPNISPAASTTHYDLLPMYLSNLYGQTSNLLNEIPQELLQFYKNLPTNFGMIPVTKS